MIEAPTSVFGFPTRPQPGVTPDRLGAASVRLSDGSIAAITLLRWEGGALNVDGLSLAGSWVLTILVELPGRRLHLCQGNSIFYTEVSAPLVESAQQPSREESPTQPRWKRTSDRQWPALQGRPLSFLGQFDTSGVAGYVFGSDYHSQLVVHLQRLDEQDIEDHYDDESDNSDA